MRHSVRQLSSEKSVGKFEFHNTFKLFQNLMYCRDQKVNETRCTNDSYGALFVSRLWGFLVGKRGLPFMSLKAKPIFILSCGGSEITAETEATGSKPVTGESHFSLLGSGNPKRLSEQKPICYPVFKGL